MCSIIMTSNSVRSTAILASGDFILQYIVGPTSTDHQLCNVILPYARFKRKRFPFFLLRSLSRTCRFSVKLGRVAEFGQPAKLALGGSFKRNERATFLHLQNWNGRMAFQFGKLGTDERHLAPKKKQSKNCTFSKQIQAMHLHLHSPPLMSLLTLTYWVNRCNSAVVLQLSKLLSYVAFGKYLCSWMWCLP